MRKMGRRVWVLSGSFAFISFSALLLSIMTLPLNVVLTSPLRVFIKVTLVPFVAIVQSQIPLTDTEGFWARVNAFADDQSFEYDRGAQTRATGRYTRVQEIYRRPDGVWFSVQTQFGNLRASFNAEGDGDQGKKIIAAFQAAFKDYNFISLPLPPQNRIVSR